MFCSLKCFPGHLRFKKTEWLITKVSRITGTELKSQLPAGVETTNLLTKTPRKESFPGLLLWSRRKRQGPIASSYPSTKEAFQVWAFWPVHWSGHLVPGIERTCARLAYSGFGARYAPMDSRQEALEHVKQERFTFKKGTFLGMRRHD